MPSYRESYQKLSRNKAAISKRNNYLSNRNRSFRPKGSRFNHPNQGTYRSRRTARRHNNKSWTNILTNRANKFRKSISSFRR